MKKEIFVMTHKKCYFPNIPGYYLMQVGSALREDLGYLRDNEGEDNISDLNPYYAELTGLYWIWRNRVDNDIVGLCHYRRLFINDKTEIMTMQEYEDLLQDADIILAEAEREANRSSHPMFAAVERVLASEYPEDLPVFRESCRTDKGSFANLFVMKGELLNDYCEWLFNILAEATGYIDLESYDDYHKKMPAIVAEELLGVYAKSRALKTKFCHAALFGEKKETTELKLALQLLMEENRLEEAVQMYDKVLASRPDLILSDADPYGELKKTVSLLQEKIGG